MNQIDVLGGAGHVTIKWDPKKRGEVTRAHKEFDKLQQAGFSFFTVPKGKKAPTKLDKWDSKVGLVRVDAFEKLGKTTTAMRPARGG
ncbi:MAG TPA: hypothetical protein VFK94_06565 [Patescibacteria group bacterium]|nr:hypothetical protein [Patescibacteria group bacterium]